MQRFRYVLHPNRCASSSSGIYGHDAQAMRLPAPSPSESKLRGSKAHVSLTVHAKYEFSDDPEKTPPAAKVFVQQRVATGCAKNSDALSVL